MSGKCANQLCTNSSRQNGKQYRLDINIGSQSGKSQMKTEFIWLCEECAARMYPRVEVVGNTIRVLLCSTAQTRKIDVSWKRAQ